ncbi:MAG: iron complex outermembrane receptor protein [Candidatus Azotimanducaceae bacterium]|jgi:iron complex outermembrane receptor protein
MFQKKRLTSAILAALAITGTTTAMAEIEEIVVTATKRSASTQDIAVAVTALGEKSLDDFGIANFDDYLLQLPGVTAGGSGPGQNTIYIRGVASTTPNLTTAGVAGLAPNVALYLDEQPLSQPGRNLDVYAADMNRVEVLKGPQGTLFGASSQAGTVRLITNKPDPSGQYASVDFGTSHTKDGEMSNNVEAMVNIPLSDVLTVRGVVYVDNQGGYIDNVAGTRDLRDSGRFRDAGTIRSNGEPVSPRRSGFQSAGNVANRLAAGDTLSGQRITDFSGVTFLEANNSGLVEDDINETTYSGGRIALLWDINEDWTLLAGFGSQDVDSEGVFFSDPDLGDYEIQRFEDDSIEDKYTNYNWTLTGRIGELEVLYTGAFTDRETNQRVDYTDYMHVGQYLPYYICDSSVSYPEYNYSDPNPALTDNLPGGTCQAPNLFVKSETELEVSTHEVRITTNESSRIRGTFGAFYSDLELTEKNDFTYPGSVSASIFPTFGDPQTGFSPGFPFPDAYNSDAGPFPADVIFRNDIRRTDEQMAFFGEVTIDVSDQLALTFGGRYYDIEVDFEGGANGQFCNGWNPDTNRFGTNLDDLYDGDGSYTFNGDCGSGGNVTFTQGQSFDEIKGILQAADSFSVGKGASVSFPNAISDGEIQGIVNSLSAPDKSETSGSIFKFTTSWTPNSDSLLYATISEGFRPGMLNRPGGAVGANGFTVPFELDTDDVTNYEFGWKLDLFNYTTRFNGNFFFVEIESLQTTIFDPSISNLFFSDNAADAEVKGFEGDITWAPATIDGLLVNASFSVLDSEITKVLTPTNDVRKGDELAFAPEFQGNVSARYEWQLKSGLTAHVMPHVAYSSKSYSDVITINRDEIDSWVMVGFTAGVSGTDWTAEFFGENVFNEQAELSRNFVFDVQRVTYSRPATFGVRVSYDFM